MIAPELLAAVPVLVKKYPLEVELAVPKEALVGDELLDDPLPTKVLRATDIVS